MTVFMNALSEITFVSIHITEQVCVSSSLSAFYTVHIKKMQLYATYKWLHVLETGFGQIS